MERGEHGGTLEKAQRVAAPESPKTTPLYDRTQDAITRGEVERIAATLEYLKMINSEFH